MKRIHVRRSPAAAVLITAAVLATPAHAQDPVREWSQHAAGLSVLPASGLAPVEQTRAMAIVHVSVHDAVSSITGRYETYMVHDAAPAGASPQAAAIGAAYHSLSELFDSPSAQSLLDGALASSLAAHGISLPDSGFSFGVAVAADILALRANDGSAVAQFDYTAPGAGSLGVWVRLTAAPALLPGWGNVSPWVMRSGSQFRPDGPPSLDSERYARDYNEVMAVGGATGGPLTPEQTIALFWRASPVRIWNDVLNQVLAARPLDLSDTARVFALFHLAGADASIAVWEAKYTYNFWRPLPAIRAGDLDPNPNTVGSSTWQPFLNTPAHPEYPSGHTSNSGAMAAILAVLFDDYPGVPLSVTIVDAQTTITRTWLSFSEAVDEVIDARVYSGFHFRTADEVGARLGRTVARFVMTHALRPCRGRGARCSSR